MFFMQEFIYQIHAIVLNKYEFKGQSAKMNYKQLLREWMYDEAWDIEATFTFADGVILPQAQRTMGLFWFNVSEELYGRALRRYNKRCEQFTFYELYSDNTNVHCHSIVKFPAERFENVEAYCKHLRGKWREICRQNIIIQINPIRQNKNEWIDYITKDVGTENFDSLDLHSSYIAPKAS
jgi:hypothetical protein